MAKKSSKSPRKGRFGRGRGANGGYPSGTQRKQVGSGTRSLAFRACFLLDAKLAIPQPVVSPTFVRLDVVRIFGALLAIRESTSHLFHRGVQTV